MTQPPEENISKDETGAPQPPSEARNPVRMLAVFLLGVSTGIGVAVLYLTIR